MFTPILITAKNSRELRNNVNPTSKKFNFSSFLNVFVRTKNFEKWEKNNPS